jgi:hypothetical protein
VELTGLAGDALGDDAGVFIDENGHDSLSVQDRTGALCAATVRPTKY